MTSTEPEGASARRHFDYGSGKFYFLFSFKTIDWWPMTLNFREGINFDNAYTFHIQL